MVCGWADSPGCFDVSPENYAQKMMHGQVCCRDQAANHHLTIAMAFLLYCISQTMKNIEVVLLINCLAWGGHTRDGQRLPTQLT